MKELKVLTVCGAGVGTSTLLRMNINDRTNNFAESFVLPDGEHQPLPCERHEL